MLARGLAVPVSYKTPAMLLLVKSGKRLVGDREKINIFGNEYFVTVNQFVMTTVEIVYDYFNLGTT